VVLDGPRPPGGPDGPVITSFTALCRVRPGAGGRLESLLERLPVGRRSPLNVDSTHYARLQVIDQIVGPRLRRRPLTDAVLVLSADVDGTAEAWLDEVLRQDPDVLAEVLSHCTDAPDDPTVHDFPERAAAFLLARRVPVALHYVNDPGHTAGEVRRAVRRHRALAGFALGHRHSTPAERRAAFMAAFGRPVPDGAGGDRR
jgi:hypothetical protein